jgi:hypothetical protein
MLIKILLTHAFGIFLFMFILWKKLKDDFAPELIFRLAFSVLVGLGIGVIISIRYFSQYFFYFCLVGGLLGVIPTIIKFRSKFYEIFEAFIIALLPWLSLIFFLDSVAHSSLSSFLEFLGMLIIIFISYWLTNHYKSFSWYRSGKIGFTGLTTLMIIFLSRFIIAIFGISMISFGNLKLETILSGLGVLVCTAQIIILAKRTE